MATPIIRISKGRFAPEKLEKVRDLIQQSATPLVPAITELPGLIYYRAAVDPATNTVVNVSIWKDLSAAKQMDTLQAMRNQLPVLEGAGVTFDKIANYEALWTTGSM
jgi:quinol monooxygenase YgiN